ncbi:type IV pilus assembly protein PilM, partial [Desulfocapsa sp. AH-315-J15]|nr:type IV pilus assembly protein PilM [Desulfocapsa sp. AH-315-J15]
MNLPFFSSDDLVVGIDIGSHAIKICQLKRTDKAYAVVNLGSATLPEDAVDDGTLNDPELVGKTIAELLKNLKIKKKKVGFSISGYSVIVKKVNLAVMSEDELEEHIQSEAEQYIPFDIDDVYLDFQDLKTNKGNSDRTDVMLVAAKKEIVDDYLEMLEGLNLKPVIVDVDGFALENTYEYNYPKDENVALVDIGASKMNINIISNGISVVARDIVVGSRQLTEQIQAAFDLEFAEAEALKLGHIPAEEKQEEIADIFSSTCTQWVL